MDCTVCNKQVSTMAVGAGVYCRDCGTRLDKGAAVPARPKTSGRVDLGAGLPRPTAQATTAARPRPAAASAKGGVLDLRASRPAAAARGSVRIATKPAVTATKPVTQPAASKPVQQTVATPKPEAPTPTFKPTSVIAEPKPVVRPALPVVHPPHPHTIEHDRGPAVQPSATLESAIAANHPHHGADQESIERAVRHAENEGELHVVRADAPVVREHTAVKLPHFTDRFERAKSTSRSAAIGKFHIEHPAEPVAAPADQPAGRELPAHAITHHEALTRLVNAAPSLHLPDASSRRGRVIATVAAVAVLSGYVWLHNYPKLAIAAAGNTAGLSASLPGYMPSSFSLKDTHSQPGLVTLSFASPNQTTPLNIEQRATEWDSKSLLDNYVAKAAKDYAAIDGQGLTVYMFGQNQASWINHGVWYSISNASRLSREQVLKIAYSL